MPNSGGATPEPLKIDLTPLLDAAVEALGGQTRPGQIAMAKAVAARSTTASTCWCRPAPVPASRWRTWSRRWRTTSA